MYVLDITVSNLYKINFKFSLPDQLSSSEIQEEG